jgi:hypothetical protein
MYESGLVANSKDDQKMEADFQGGNAREDGPVLLACFGNSSIPWCTPMEMISGPAGCTSSNKHIWLGSLSLSVWP